MNINKYK